MKWSSWKESVRSILGNIKDRYHDVPESLMDESVKSLAHKISRQIRSDPIQAEGDASSGYLQPPEEFVDRKCTPGVVSN